MNSLVYVSKANQSFSDADIQELASQASQRNTQLLVTGFLSYKEGHFFQYLEGNQRVLEELMHSIQEDARHTVLRVVHLPPQRERRFGQWHMRYFSPYETATISLEELLRDTIDKVGSDFYEEERAIRMVLSIIDKFSQYFAVRPQIPLPSPEPKENN